MDKAYIEELYLSVRPYLSDSTIVSSFLDSHADALPQEFTAAIEDAVGTYDGTRKTDFTILLNAHLKLMGSD